MQYMLVARVNGRNYYYTGLRTDAGDRYMPTTDKDPYINIYDSHNAAAPDLAKLRKDGVDASLEEVH